MRRFGLSMLAVVGALGISLMAANEKPSTAMMEVMKRMPPPTRRPGRPRRRTTTPRSSRTRPPTEQTWRTSTPIFPLNKLDAAATIAKGGLKGAMDLEAAATAKDAAGVAKAMAAVTGTCGGCHKQFREQLADKTYEIKLP